jgi:glycosyltransferase involved in cell wall biosynthesis
MDVLVLPSRSTPTWTEQFGRVLVEALSFAVPVVGSDSGEIGWVIEVTGGGFVFPEGDAGALAGLLTRLRGDPALRASLGRVGQERARALFNLSTVADRLNAALVANLASDVVRRS